MPIRVTDINLNQNKAKKKLGSGFIAMQILIKNIPVPAGLADADLEGEKIQLI